MPALSVIPSRAVVLIAAAAMVAMGLLFSIGRPASVHHPRPTAAPARDDPDDTRFDGVTRSTLFYVDGSPFSSVPDLEPTVLHAVDEKLAAPAALSPGGLEVRAFPFIYAPYRNRHGTAAAGFPIAIVNRGSVAQRFFSDSNAIRVFHEAMNAAGEWHAINPDPNTYCGTGHATLELQPGERWILVAPLYRGVMTTEFRFRVQPDNGPPVYSATYTERIDPRQLQANSGRFIAY